MPTGAGKSLCYQLPALEDTERLTRGGLAAGLADAGPGRGPGGPGRAGERAARRRRRTRSRCGGRWPGEVQPALRRARAVLDARVRRAAQGPGRDVRRGRGALREPVGTRLPARVLPPRRRRAAARAHGRSSPPPPPPRRASPWTSSGASGCATRCGSPPASSGRTSRYDVVPVRGDRGARERALGAAGASPGRCRRSSTPAPGSAPRRRRRGSAASWGGRCPAYHAGMEREPRAESQRAFMAGEAPVVVATNAFGMGVDKADVRTVVHEAVPSSLEAYYQEAGRGGPRRAAVALRAARERAGQGPARVLHQPDRGSRGEAPALGAVPGDLGLRRRRGLPARGDPEALRRPDGAPGRGPVLRRLRRPAGDRGGAGPARRRATGRRRRRGRRSSRSSSPRRRRSAGRARSRSCAAGAARSS